jgi:hypothetical protein
VKYVASYNWINAEKPTIVVPGEMPSLPYIFVLIPVIDSLQVRLLYELGAPSHPRCSPMMLLYILAGIGQSCPNTRCYHFWPLRTGYIAKVRRHLSTGQLWTSSRSATLCATSCAGPNRQPQMRASWTFYWRFAQYLLKFGRDGYECAPRGEHS